MYQYISGGRRVEGKEEFQVIIFCILLNFAVLLRRDSVNNTNAVTVGIAILDLRLDNYSESTDISRRAVASERA